MSTHTGNANFCPHYSQTVSEIRLPEYSTACPNKTRRPWASRSGAGEEGGLLFPAWSKGARIWGRYGVSLPRTQCDTGRVCLEKHRRTFSPQAALTHRSYLGYFTTLPDKHLPSTHTQNLLVQEVSSRFARQRFDPL